MSGPIVASTGQRLSEIRRTGICVIGSGPGGGIPAVLLAELGHEVLVLEAGPEIGGPGAGEYLRDTEVDGELGLPFMGMVQLGGASNLWAGRMAPLEAVDFTARDWVPMSGWPITAADLPFAQALKLLAGSSEIDWERLPPPPVFAPAVGENGLDIKRFLWARKAFNVGRYLTQAAARYGSRLQVSLDSPVLEMVEADNGSGIAAVLVRKSDGGILRVEADCFILAAGGIESARILLSSRNRSPNGIGNRHDLVGRFLSTHPKANLAMLTLARRVSVRHPLFRMRRLDQHRVRFGIGFGPEAQSRLNLLNHYVQLTASLELYASSAFETLSQLDAVQTKTLSQSRLGSRALAALGRFLFNGVDRLTLLQGRSRRFVLRAFLDQYPDPANRVTLSGETNARGIPTSDLAWTYSARDRASVLRFLQSLDDELRKQEIGHLDFEPLRRAGDNWPLTAIHSHYMGTTRMATSASEGVVDANCQVFGQANLFVSGPSVFTTYGFANPFLTIAALGLRLANHIHGRQRPEA